MSAPTHPPHPSGLLRNQLRKETRQNAWFIAIGIALVAMELVDGLMVTASPFDAVGNRTAEAVLSTLIPVALGLTAVAMAVRLGFSDAPANPSGFILTRPVPASAIWGAKAITLLTFLLVPALTVPLIVGLAHGTGISHAALATLDRLALAAPVLALALCASALCRHRGQLARYLLLALPAIYSCIMLGAVILVLTIGETALEARFRSFGEVPSRLFLWLCLAAVAAVFCLGLEIRGGRWKWRPLSLVVLLIALALASAFTPGLNFLNQSPATAAAAGFDQVKVTPDPYSVTVWENTDGSVRTQAETAIANIPSGCYIDQLLDHATITTEGGTRLVSRPVSRWDDGRPTEAILYTLAEIYDGNLRIHRKKFGRDLRQNYTFGATWDESQIDALLDEDSQITYHFELHSQKLTRVATLPLRDGATARSQPAPESERGSTIEFTLFHPTERRGANGMFGLRTRLEQRWLTAEPSKSFLGSGDREHFRYLCLLVRPGNRDAFLCGPSALTATRGVFAGTPEAVQMFYYGRPEFASGSGPGDDAEIHIFKMEPAGTARLDVSLPTLRLADRISKMSSGSSPQRLEYPQYLAALTRLGSPPSGDDAALARYLQALASTIDRARNGGQMGDDPALAMLLGVGRDEGLDPLLAQIMVMGNGPSSWYFLTAVDRLATASDKAAIIAALPEAPELAQVIVTHGWELEAKAEIMSLLERRKIMPYSLLQAANALRDPATHPYLLEQFARNMNSGTYDLLSAQPTLRPRLEAAILDRWRSTYRLVAPAETDHGHTQITELALRLGDQVAFETVFQNAFHEPDQYNAVSSLRRVMILSNEYRQAALTLQGSTPSDYTYDPVRRIFTKRIP